MLRTRDFGFSIPHDNFEEFILDTFPLYTSTYCFCGRTRQVGISYLSTGLLIYNKS
jgi:hypothetical protein